MRYRPGDQAKLIDLAQKRAYGAFTTHTKKDNARGGNARDVTAHVLNNLLNRTTLPEYKGTQVIDDAEIL